MSPLVETRPKDYLTSKGIPFKEHYGELITACLFNGCDEDSRPNEAHLYLSAETGQYHCKKCDAKGNIVTLAKHLGDNSYTANSKWEAPLHSAQKTDNQLTKFNPVTVEECHAALPDRIRFYLGLRGISERMISEHKIGFGKFYGKNWITIPIKDSEGEYSFLKLRQDPEDTANKNKYKFYPAGSEAMLFGLESIKDQEVAMICEGEFDCMLLQANTVPAITSTAGATSCLVVL